MDKIDRVLFQHYDFTDEELDFIINYDIKYRTGLGWEVSEKPEMTLKGYKDLAVFLVGYSGNVVAVADLLGEDFSNY